MMRRDFLALASAPLASSALRGRVERAGLGEVVFCRASDAEWLRISRQMFPRAVASCEPRAGFRGVTLCGARATFTLTDLPHGLF
ncbi:MAG TPA: hypothetical protein VHW24_18485 [Bryobacteraceae bacterium]|nr:hypothetical protein [Bryobacteraceae bacterium]